MAPRSRFREPPGGRRYGVPQGLGPSRRERCGRYPAADLLVLEPDAARALTAPLMAFKATLAAPVEPACWTIGNATLAFGSAWARHFPRFVTMNSLHVRRSSLSSCSIINCVRNIPCHGAGAAASATEGRRDEPIHNNTVRSYVRLLQRKASARPACRQVEPKQQAPTTTPQAMRPRSLQPTAMLPGPRRRQSA